MESILERNKREQYMLEKLIPQLGIKFYEYSPTDLYSTLCYDGIIRTYENDLTKEIFILEIKIRDKYYSSKMLESKKYQSLLEIKKQIKRTTGINPTIFYIVSDPQ